MKRVICLIPLISMCVLLLAASWAAAQSLADVAKKEKERRKQLESSESRTITDVELRRAPGPRTLSTTSTSSSESESDDGDDPDAEDDEQPIDERRTEAYWRGRLAPIDTRIQTLEERLQSPQFTSNPVGGADRQRIEQQLAQARSQRQAILDEARREGVPPGWLR